MKMNKYNHLIITDYSSQEEFIDMFYERAAMMDDYGVIELFGKADFIHYVFTALLSGEYECYCGLIEFANGIYDEDYQQEYVLSLDNEMTICIEPAWTENGVAHIDAEMAYVYQEDVSQKLMEELLDDDGPVTLFGIESEHEFVCNHDCENCHLYDEEHEAEPEEPKDPVAEKLEKVMSDASDWLVHLDKQIAEFEKQYHGLFQGLYELFGK